jgi:hypothetical protein
VGQVSGSWSLNEDLALVGYYQYEWEKTELNPVGTISAAIPLVPVPNSIVWAVGR